jgi:hypothetical protein
MGSMTNMTKWMLAAALALRTLGLGATQAHAARIGVRVYVGGPVAYVPPCPGPGYAWVAGYYAGGGGCRDSGVSRAVGWWCAAVTAGDTRWSTAAVPFIQTVSAGSSPSAA